ncbi:MAG: TM0106 family RecB-like putative nuclease, partial [Pseudomonadota bacterium]|nr:TM0106 family RecB-like putative nuclease [Pseudomonadota bacterium]
MKSIRASDAKSWVHCLRRAWLDNNPPQGYETIEPNEFDQLVITLGNRHEWNVKRQLEKQYQVVEAVSEDHTRALMEAGAQIIYQGRLHQDDIIGIPDFLIQHESGAYQPADAKLARSEEKKEIQIQLGIYRKLLGSGLKALAFLGTGEVTEIGDEADKEVEKFLTSMREILAQPTPPAVRYSESKCKACGYYNVCKPQFEAKGELTLLYGIDSRAAPGLEKQGINSIRKLADADPATIEDVPYLKGLEKRQRAVLQAKSYFDDSFHQLKPIVLPGGTWIHFDIETNPLTESGQEHIYLWGLLKPPYNGGSFDYVWTDSDSQDRQGWEAFLAKMEDYRRTYPNLVLAHFSGFERQKIEAYAER